MPPHPSPAISITQPTTLSGRGPFNGHRRCLLLFVLASLALSGCGDSGGSGDANGGAGVGATGSTSVFLTDAPSDDFDRILITIESIQLIGGGTFVTLFSGSETIDLLDLENRVVPQVRRLPQRCRGWRQARRADAAWPVWPARGRGQRL